jgi:uncharacterized ion transporter superfamily protein YfcC
MKLTRFKAPDTTLIIFSIIVLAALLAWVIPPGAFETVEMETAAGTKNAVVPGSFHFVERADVGFVARVIGTLGAILTAPILGIIDAADIIGFVLLVGGAFGVLQRTGAVDAGLERLVRGARRSRSVELLTIPLFMILFSLGGATFGMSEETVPFILIFVPLALSLGYDSITGVAIPFVGAGAGFAGAFLNPFTVGVAQGIAEVPLFSGQGFRIVLWLVITSVAVAYVMWHAHRVKRDPEKSPVYEIDQKKRAAGVHATEEGFGRLSRPQVWVLVVFFAGIALLVWGVTQQGWYIVEIAALFLAMGIAMGIAGRLGPSETSQAFMAGAKDLLVTALVIGLARGILIVMQDAQIIDPILHALASVIGEAGPTIAAQVMFLVQTAINFFVPSGSGQAALTMPIMAPLSDLVGVSRQTAVLAYQLGDGFTNLIIPTSAILMGALALADVPWQRWARWILPLQLIFIALGFLALAIAVASGWGAASVAVPVP